MRQHDLQAALKKVRAAVDDLGRLIDQQSKSRPRKPLGLSRRKLCEIILRERPGLQIYEVMEELRKRGAGFTARNPINSVRTTLYRSPEFVCVDGRFSLKPTVAKSDASRG
jgi:hypothetical protein